MNPPTITSGQEKQIDWRIGLEEAVLLCTGRRTTDSLVTSPSPSCMVPTTQPPGAGAVVADNLMGTLDFPLSVKQELHPGLNSTSFDSSFDQQSVGPIAGNAGRDYGQLKSTSGRLGESRVDSEENLPSRTSFSGPKPEPQVKVRRRVGRPIMDKGDPNDPAMTEKERRHIKRRIANRESARRVRNRRQGELEEQQLQIEDIREKNRELRQRSEDTLQERNHLAKEVEALRCQLGRMTAMNQRMEAEMQALQQSLQTCPPTCDPRQIEVYAPKSEPDKGVAAVNEMGALSSAFGTTTVKPISMAGTPPTASAKMPSAMSLELQFSGAMALFPSLELDRIDHEALPSINLDCLLDGSYHNCAN